MSSLREQVVEDLQALPREEQDRAVELASVPVAGRGVVDALSLAGGGAFNVEDADVIGSASDCVVVLVMLASA